MELKKSTNNKTIFKNATSPRPFFQAYTYAFQNDEKISLAAKGLLAMMLSFGPGWKFYMNDLGKRCTNGRDSLRHALKELISAQYVEQKRVQNPNGRFYGWSYIIYDRPYRNTENPILDKSLVEKNDIEKCKHIINTTNNNNNINNNNKQTVDVNLVNELKNFEIEENTAILLISKYGIEKVQFQFINLKESLKTGHDIKNNVAWFRDALKNNYQPCHTTVVPTADPVCPNCHGTGKIHYLIDDTGDIVPRPCPCLQSRS